jgi:signal transduction histidine kinase
MRSPLPIRTRVSGQPAVRPTFLVGLLIAWTLVTLWSGFAALVIEEYHDALNQAGVELTAVAEAYARYAALLRRQSTANTIDVNELADFRRILVSRGSVQLSLHKADEGRSTISTVPEKSDEYLAASGRVPGSGLTTMAQISRINALAEWWHGTWIELVGMLVVSFGMIALGMVLVGQLRRREAAQSATLSAMRAAETANLAKSQFLANLGHELRTPLSSIIGFAEMVNEGHAGPVRPKQVEYIGIIQESGKQLLTIVNDVLDLVKNETGDIELCDVRPVDPRAISQGCITTMLRRAAGKLRLSLNVEPGLLEINADAARLRQILLKLLDNAIKFTPAGGAVELRVCAGSGSGTVAFIVSDNGPGMSRDEIEIAAKLFRQADSNPSRLHNGNGLGLPLAIHLTKLHGGTLSIDSERGRGTQVTVQLPQPFIVVKGDQQSALA